MKIKINQYDQIRFLISDSNDCLCTTSKFSSKYPPNLVLGVSKTTILVEFSTNNLVGVYNKTSHILQIIVKENIDNIEIIIYKNGIVREYDADQDIQNGDFKNYLLNNYGSGEYTIYIKINDGTEIIRSFKW